MDRVLVVDDASTDRTCEVVDEHVAAHGGASGRVSLLRQDTNRGQGAAVARGYREIIEQKFEEAVISESVAYAKVIPDAVKVLDTVWT